MRGTDIAQELGCRVLDELSPKSRVQLNRRIPPVNMQPFIVGRPEILTAGVRFLRRMPVTL